MPDLDVGESWIGKEAPEPVCSGQWLNSPPLALRGLRGKVVLLDFLSYSCVNCLRTLPYLQRWHEKYAAQGLVVIGLHTPEFEFEKDAGNLAKALEKAGVRFPVMQDNDYLTWKAYRNNFWPREFLVDRQGKIVYDHVGEGGYEQTEKALQQALGVRAPLTQPLAPDGSPAPKKLGLIPIQPLTGELYVGYARGLIGNIEGFDPDQEIEYADPEYVEGGLVYVKGTWMSRAQYMHHSRVTDGKDEYAFVKYYGQSANAVLAPAHTGSFKLYLELDGKPLQKNEAGPDVRFDEKGRSFIEVKEARMYGLVNGSPALDWHGLKMASDSREYCLYSLTFGL